MALLPYYVEKSKMLWKVLTNQRSLLVAAKSFSFLFFKKKEGERITWEKVLAFDLIINFLWRQLSYISLWSTQWHHFLKILFLNEPEANVQNVSLYKSLFLKKQVPRLSSHLVIGSSTNCKDSDNRMNTQHGHCTLIKDLNNTSFYWGLEDVLRSSILQKLLKGL